MPAAGYAEEDIAINPDHPDRYIVQRGDTLWSIAGKFLSNPWQWPNVWHNNSSIENPNLIFPGDELVFSVVNGTPRLEVGEPSEIRLSPRVRVTPLTEAIPTIPMETIRPFLSRPRVVTSQELQNAPYVLDFAGQHIVGGAGDRIYVRSIRRDDTNAYMVFRPGPSYRDAETGEVIGHEALFVADTRLERPGDPATLGLTQTAEEVRIGDRLLPVEQEKVLTRFVPHTPKANVRAHIISVLGGVFEIGQYQAVALDRGARNGLESGHVLRIFHNGRLSRDGTNKDAPGSMVRLPNEEAGTLMVFRVFDRVSYALVLRASRPLHLADLAVPP